MRGVDGFLEIEDFGADLFLEGAGAGGELEAGQDDDAVVVALGAPRPV